MHRTQQNIAKALESTGCRALFLTQLCWLYRMFVHAAVTPNARLAEHAWCVEYGIPRQSLHLPVLSFLYLHPPCIVDPRIHSFCLSCVQKCVSCVRYCAAERVKTTRPGGYLSALDGLVVRNMIVQNGGAECIRLRCEYPCTVIQCVFIAWRNVCTL